MLAICLIVITLGVCLWLILRSKKSKPKIELTGPTTPPQLPDPVPVKPIEQRKVIISHHAIDRASTRHLDVYLGYRIHEEDGLHSWLMREMKDLRMSGQLNDGENAIDHVGVLWAIIVTPENMVLKSLSFKKGKHRRKKPLSKNQIKKLKKRKGNAQMRKNN